MQKIRRALPLLAAAGMLAGPLQGCGGSGHQAQVRSFSVVVAGGKPSGGVRTLAATKGDTIKLTVVSDLADEIHIHGYDLHRSIRRPGGSVQFAFRATIDGSFVIELESKAQQIAALRVNP